MSTNYLATESPRAKCSGPTACPLPPAAISVDDALLILPMISETEVPDPKKMARLSSDDVDARDTRLLVPAHVNMSPESNSKDFSIELLIEGSSNQSKFVETLKNLLYYAENIFINIYLLSFVNASVLIGLIGTEYSERAHSQQSRERDFAVAPPDPLTYGGHGTKTDMPVPSSPSSPCGAIYVRIYTASPPRYLYANPLRWYP